MHWISVRCMHYTAPHPRPAPVIRLRVAEFDRRAQELGLGTTSECAQRIGISRFTLARLRTGEVAPGEKFIALCLSSFQAKFEELFELSTAS